MIVFLYIIAALPDLPISAYLDDGLVSKVSVAKQTFQSWESRISNGYSNYLPLFSKIEEGKVYIQVKKDLAEKVKIYKNASKKSKVLIKAGKDGIEYKDKFKKAGKKYWLKVYSEKDDVDGWIPEDVVDGAQLKYLVKLDI